MAKKFLSGNEAAAWGVALAKPHVVAIYPITPQTTIVETLTSLVDHGTLTTELLHVESEHSALAALIGASACGARTFTATSSQGLLYLAECMPYAAGGRLPIVMVNANRSLALPWNIYGDHRDAMAVLDLGWLQVHAIDAQEALDAVIEAYAVAEHPDVRLPVMVCLDGFALTHTSEAVEVPSATVVQEFLPPAVRNGPLHSDLPGAFGFSSTPAVDAEFRLQQQRAGEAARCVIRDFSLRFASTFDRDHGGLVDAWGCSDAEVVVVAVGTTAATALEAAVALRAEGERVGVLRLRWLRPFPIEELLAAIAHAKVVAVIDRAHVPGGLAPIHREVAATVATAGRRTPIAGFVAGLGGREISVGTIRDVVTAAREGMTCMESHFVDTLPSGVPA